jgi:GT2 family glycosyltransferase
MDPRGISVGIINYNGRRYLEGTLAAVLSSGLGVGEILVADGGSNDGSLDLLRSFPSVRLIELQGNPGPGVARNAVIAAARADRILLLDNDVAPVTGCVEALNAALDADRAAVLAMPAVLDAAAPGTVQYVGAEPHFLGVSSLARRDSKVSDLDDGIHPVGTVVAACLMVDRARFGARPWFDDRLFFYLEDHELGLRVALQGFTILAVPQARCLHGLGTIGISIRETGRFTPIRVRYTIRNRWLTMLMLYQPGTLLRLAPSLAAFEFFHFFGALSRGWLLHWLWAVGSTIRSLPHVLRRRRGLRRERRCSDLEVLVGGPFPFNPAMLRSAASRAAASLLNRIAGLNWRLLGGRRTGR